MTRRSAPISFLIPFALLVVSGCTAGTVVGGGASVGVAVAQERSVGDALDDTVIATQIVAIFFDYSIKLLRKVSAEVVEGRVLLTGSVAEPEGRVDAVRLTWQIDGVIEVLNEIQVTDRGGLLDFALDTWVSTQLRTKLLLDRDIRALNYNVETVNGVIYLIGIAQNELELERVTNHARTIENVVKVVSHVRIKGAS
jgi:osmotically-inducible protein OsmY